MQRHKDNYLNQIARKVAQEKIPQHYISDIKLDSELITLIILSIIDNDSGPLGPGFVMLRKYVSFQISKHDLSRIRL